MSGELASRVSSALGLPDDYFAETRLSRVVAALEADGALLDRIYAQIPRESWSRLELERADAEE